MRRYWGGFVRRLLEALGVLALLPSVVAIIAPDILRDQWWFLAVATVLAAGWALFSMRQRVPEQRYPSENVTVRLVEGDLFAQNASALVGMTTTFDTEPGIIASTSVQGSLLQKVFGGSQTRLDAALASALTGSQVEGTITKAGKQNSYPLGTVAVLPGEGTVNYYCVAYTRMDEYNRAQGTIRSVLDSLDQVWDAIDRTGNGEPICVPLLGQGQSRVPELTAEIAVRLIAFSFLLRTRRARFSRELRIVIHPSEINKVDRIEFQAFLSSLVAG